MSTQTALEAYEEKQAEIEKLLLQIKAGLLTHDRNCTRDITGGTWAT